MTNSEDFFAYPALFILGALLSIVPAYIAFKKKKNYWIWLVSITFVFVIFLMVTIQAQAISKIIYLLVILSVASILAMLPKLTITKDAWFFVSVLIVLLLIAAMLYAYLWYPKIGFLEDIEKVYFINSAIVFLIACVGLASFILIVSERRIRELIASISLVALFALPIFLDPSMAYTVGFFPSQITGKDTLLGPLITELIYYRPIAGVFILLCICSGCATITILLNDKYKISVKIADLSPVVTRKIIASLPFIRLSNNPLLSVSILVGIILYGLFVFDFNLGEAGMFLWPLYYICVGFPMIFVSFAGIILSSIVIAKSINQHKPPYAVGILMCGSLASWGAISKHFFSDYFGLPGTLLMSYGIVSGFIALLLWMISDFLGQR